MSDQPAERDQHIAIAGEKLRRFLTLADEIIALRQQIQQNLDQQGTELQGHPSEQRLDRIEPQRLRLV